MFCLNNSNSNACGSTTNNVPCIVCFKLALLPTGAILLAFRLKSTLISIDHT